MCPSEDGSKYLSSTYGSAEVQRPYPTQSLSIFSSHLPNLPITILSSFIPIPADVTSCLGGGEFQSTHWVTPKLETLSKCFAAPESDAL